MNCKVKFKIDKSIDPKILEDYLDLAETVTGSIFGNATTKLFIKSNYGDGELIVEFFHKAGELFASLVTAFLIQEIGQEFFAVIHLKHTEYTVEVPNDE
jgi:hypothetical protein